MPSKPILRFDTLTVCCHLIQCRGAARRKAAGDDLFVTRGPERSLRGTARRSEADGSQLVDLIVIIVRARFF